MRLFSGTRGVTQRPDARGIADMDVSPGKAANYGAWVAYRKTKKKGGTRGWRMAMRGAVKIKVLGAVRLRMDIIDAPKFVIAAPNVKAGTIWRHGVHCSLLLYRHAGAG